MGVYFAQAGDGGAIKIGHAANLARRISALQTGSATPLTLLGVADGGAETERRYHQLFAAHHLRGEWFAPADEIVAEAARHPVPAPASGRTKAYRHERCPACADRNAAGLLDAFVHDIEVFCERQSMMPYRLGLLAVGDAKFVARLRDDGNVTFKTAERVRAFMATYSPAQPAAVE